jgi:inositol phosphorylceramide mannosyltransferase catalytic subunit
MNVIQTWKTNEIPQHYVGFIQKMRNNNLNAKHLFFTDETIIIFIKQHMPEYYETFTKLKYKIQQIDFFRYLAIYHYGGIYLDLDMDIHGNFDDLDTTKCNFPIEIKNQDDSILLGNYAFYAPKGHPFVKHIIDSIVNPPISTEEIQFAQENHTDDKEHVFVYYTTGPELVTRCYWSYENRDEINLLVPEPYQNDCFGKYGRHCSYGSWKHPNSDQSTI